MGQAIGDILPMAVGVALSPVPIIAIVLMLGTPRARSNGPAFTLGWLIGLSVAGGIVLRRIAQVDISTGEESGALAVFIVLGSLSILAPLAMYFALGDRAATTLGALKDWMAANNATIMTVLLLVLGAKLLGDGIAGLS